MAFDFPDAPAVGDLFPAPNGPTYQWNGSVWLFKGGSGSGGGGGSGAPPIITSEVNVTLAEHTPFTQTLTASKPVIWTKLPGKDATAFTLDTSVSPPTLSLAAQDWHKPIDVNTDNIYEVDIKISDASTPPQETTTTVSVRQTINSPHMQAEFVSRAWYQESLPVGPVSSWDGFGFETNPTAELAVQTNTVRQPVKLAGAGGSPGSGVFFAASTGPATSPCLTWPNDNDAHVANRWWLVIARCAPFTGSNPTNVLCINTNSGGAASRQPRISFTSDGTMYSAWNDSVGARIAAAPCVLDGTTWNVLVGCRRGYTIQTIVNGGTPVKVTDFGGCVDAASGNGSFFGEANVTLPSDMAIDCVLFGQSELNDAQIDKLVGWGMWRVGRQADLPVGHPYRTVRPWGGATPTTDANDNPARYMFSRLEFEAWQKAMWGDPPIANEADQPRHVNRGNPAPAVTGYTTVFEDHFQNNQIVDYLTGPEGSVWYAPSINDATGNFTNKVPGQVGVMAQATRPNVVPTNYVHFADGTTHTMALRLLNPTGTAGGWKTGAFQSANRNGIGRSWGKGIFEIRCKFPTAPSATRPWIGFFPAFWGYDVEHLNWLTRARIEIDFLEYDGKDGTFLNFSQLIHGGELPDKTNQIYTPFPGIPLDFPNQKIAGYPIGPANDFPAIIDIYDGQYHTWECRIEDDFTYMVIDGLEVVRCPTTRELACEKYIQVDLAYSPSPPIPMQEAHGIPAALTDVFDMTIDYIRVRQKTTQLAIVPTGFSARPTISGTVAVGSVLTVAPNTIGSQIEYRWYRTNGVPIISPIAGPIISNTYTVTADDIGHGIRVHVMNRSILNRPFAWTADTATVGGTTDTAGPVFTSGTSASVDENQTLMHGLTATDASPPISFTITGGIDAAHFSIIAHPTSGLPTLVFGPHDFEVPTDAVDGATPPDNIYKVQITATDALGNPTVNNFQVTVNNVTETSTSVINGTGQLGTSLWCEGLPAYQWRRDGTDDIPGAISPSYRVTEADVGHSLTCRANGTVSNAIACTWVFTHQSGSKVLLHFDGVLGRYWFSGTEYTLNGTGGGPAGGIQGLSWTPDDMDPLAGTAQYTTNPTPTATYNASFLPFPGYDVAAGAVIVLANTIPNVPAKDANLFAFAQGDSTSTVISTIGTWQSGGALPTSRFNVTSSGSSQCQINASLIWEPSNDYWVASKYKANDFWHVARDGEYKTDTAGTVPGMDRLRIGSGGSGNASGAIVSPGVIKQFAYIPGDAAMYDVQYMMGKTTLVIDRGSHIGENDSLVGRDLFNDGYPAFVNAMEDGRINLYRQQVCGVFTRTAIKSATITGAKVEGICLFDRDGDGVMRLMVADQGLGQIRMYAPTTPGNYAQVDWAEETLFTGKTNMQDVMAIRVASDDRDTIVYTNEGSGGGSLAANGSVGKLRWNKPTDSPPSTWIDTMIKQRVGAWGLAFTRFSNGDLCYSTRGNEVGRNSAGNNGIYRLSLAGVETVIDDETRTPVNNTTFTACPDLRPTIGDFFGEGNEDVAAVRAMAPYDGMAFHLYRAADSWATKVSIPHTTAAPVSAPAPTAPIDRQWAVFNLDYKVNGRSALMQIASGNASQWEWNGTSWEPVRVWLGAVPDEYKADDTIARARQTRGLKPDVILADSLGHAIRVMVLA